MKTALALAAFALAPCTVSASDPSVSGQPVQTFDEARSLRRAVRGLKIGMTPDEVCSALKAFPAISEGFKLYLNQMGALLLMPGPFSSLGYGRGHQNLDVTFHFDGDGREYRLYKAETRQNDGKLLDVIEK
jgi:hypothetical protein